MSYLGDSAFGRYSRFGSFGSYGMGSGLNPAEFATANANMWARKNLPSLSGYSSAQLGMISMGFSPSASDIPNWGNNFPLTPAPQRENGMQRPEWISEIITRLEGLRDSMNLLFPPEKIKKETTTENKGLLINENNAQKLIELLGNIVFNKGDTEQIKLSGNIVANKGKATDAERLSGTNKSNDILYTKASSEDVHISGGLGIDDLAIVDLTSATGNGEILVNAHTEKLAIILGKGQTCSDPIDNSGIFTSAEKAVKYEIKDKDGNVIRSIFMPGFKTDHGKQEVKVLKKDDPKAHKILGDLAEEQAEPAATTPLQLDTTGLANGSVLPFQQNGPVEVLIDEGMVYKYIDQDGDGIKDELLIREYTANGKRIIVDFGKMPEKDKVKIRTKES